MANFSYLSGYVKAIFSEVCSKIKDLIGAQLAVVEEREGKKSLL